MRLTVSYFCRLFCCLFLLQLPTVQAHPHSWVSVFTEIEGDSQQITGLRMFWTFDLITTSDALDGQDLSEKNQQSTLKKLASEMLSNIHDSQYFTHLQHNQTRLSFIAPQQATLTLEDYKLTLNFFLELEKPLTLPVKDLNLKIYEDSYYVDFLWLQHNDLQMSEQFSGDCQLNIVEPQTTSEQIAYASSLGVDAPSNDSLGVMFTQKVMISCD